MKIQIKNRYDGSIIFEHECENNSVKETLIQSIKKGANLLGAYLEGANLQGAYIPIFSKWAIGIIDNKIIKIGCKKMTPAEWDFFLQAKKNLKQKEEHLNSSKLKLCI